MNTSLIESHYFGIRIALVLTVVSVVGYSPTVLGRGGMGGIARGGIAARERDNVEVTMKWYDSLQEALSASREADPALPVFGYLRIAGGAADRSITSSLFANKTIAEMSHTSFAAFVLDVGVRANREQAIAWGVKTDGALAWFDDHGNCIKRQTGRLSYTEILKTVKYWRSMLDLYQRQVDQRVARAQSLIKRNKHITALDALLPVSRVVGPAAEKVRPLLAQIEKLGNTLLDTVDTMKHGRRGRAMLLSSIAREYQGTVVEDRARRMMQVRSSKGETELAAARPASPTSVIDSVISATRRPGSNAGSTTVDDGAAPPTDAASASALLMQARELYKQGKLIYQKASQSGSRAELQEAFEILTRAGDLAETASEKRPRDTIASRLVEDISRLRYACFKQQVL